MIPPHNLEAEKSVLGSMLLDNKIMANVSTTLVSDDFYKPAHKEIFSAALEVHTLNNPVDIITVSDKLSDKNMLDAVGGYEYLAELAGSVPTTENVKQYIATVKGKSIRRQFINIAQSIIELACNGEYDNIQDLKSDALSMIDIDIRATNQTSPLMRDAIVKVFDDIEEKYNSKDIGGLKYGFDWLDKNTGGAHVGEMTILAARPSIGKTTLAINIAANMAKRGKNVAIFSLEMYQESLIKKMLSSISRVPFEHIRYAKALTDKEWETLGQASGEMISLPIYIYDTIHKLEGIRGTCVSLKAAGTLDYVIVDYLQLAETSKKSSTSVERVSHLSRQFKLLTLELKVPILLLSQLNRSSTHENRRPQLQDLRDSGAIEQDADNVLFLHDPKYGEYNREQEPDKMPIEIIIAKQRNGMRDICSDLYFYKRIQKFYDR